MKELNWRSRCMEVRPNDKNYGKRILGIDGTDIYNTHSTRSIFR